MRSIFWVDFPFLIFGSYPGVCILTAICKFQHEKCKNVSACSWWYENVLVCFWPSVGQDPSLPAPQRSSSTMLRSCTTRPSTQTPETAWTLLAACPSRSLEAWPSPAACCSSTGTEDQTGRAAFYHILQFHSGSFRRFITVCFLGQFLLWCSGSGWISPSTLLSTTQTVTLPPPSLPSKNFL